MEIDCDPKIERGHAKELLSRISEKGIDKSLLQGLKKLISKDAKYMDDSQITVFFESFEAVLYAGGRSNKYEIHKNDEDSKKVTTSLVKRGWKRIFKETAFIILKKLPQIIGATVVGAIAGAVAGGPAGAAAGAAAGFSAALGKTVVYDSNKAIKYDIDCDD